MLQGQEFRKLGHLLVLHVLIEFSTLFLATLATPELVRFPDPL